MILTPVCVSLIWYSPNVDDQGDADLDNVAKPYLDAIQGLLIPEDRRVRHLKMIKVSINDLQDIPGVLEAKTSSQFDAKEGFVMMVVEPLAAEHIASFVREVRSE